MIKYKQNYLNATGLTTADTILCEVCGAVAIDLHHVTLRSQGGTDDYNNLIALCGGCHDLAHNKTGCKDFQIKLKEICELR